MHGQGLPYKNIPRFLELLGKSRGVPNQYKQEMLSIGRWAQYTSRNDLTKQTVEFSAGSGGNCKVLQFYIRNNRAEQKLDLFILTVENSFKLAPDVFVILEETSQFWGMKSSANIRFEKRPASLKPDQIKFVSDYFSLIALEELADFLNVENGKPNMKPKAGGSNMDTMWDNADLFTTKSKPTSKWVNNMLDPDFFREASMRNSRMVWRGNKAKKYHHSPKLTNRETSPTHFVDPDFFHDSMQKTRMEWRANEAKQYYPVPQSKHIGSRGMPKRKRVTHFVDPDFFHESMQNSRMEWSANEAKTYYPVPQSKHIVGSRGMPKRKRCCEGMRPVCIQCRRQILHAKVLRVCKKKCRRRQFPMNRSMCLEDCAERLMRKLRYQNRRSANFYL